ncbi:MAG: hypothetical protein EON58_15315 [Alphaproteobacteria bacterium]|nr:MAG: hypothetical protein EON58_15315 [Alphaproteobacteria bacterium]
MSRIRLYAVSDPAKLNLPLHLPPTGLPQRHLFWREEMGDGAISPDKPDERGVENRVAWYDYKARLMQFLGMNTFSKDLLEFGHNQGWDAGPNNDWYNASHYPELWGDILTQMGKYAFTVLPYYEYAGSVGQKSLGKEKRAMPLGGGKDYTHISWTEGYNADITDPDTLTDAKRLLDATIVRYKDRVPFLGAWFRPRPSQFPIGFADPTLARFAKEANNGQAVTRPQLQGDKALLTKYYGWWFGKRREFLLLLRDYLRTQGIAGADILLTTDASEPGRSLTGPMAVVTDDVDTWNMILREPAHKNVVALPYVSTVQTNQQFAALTTPRGTWDKWEWQHSDPEADPQNYQNTEGALLTYSFNRAYTVSSSKGFDAFRTKSGLAAILHYPLNEKSMEPSLGYIGSDMEYAGPYCMLAEARAVAYGDPDYIGYLAASSFNRGFPEYVRAFNAAYLSLPALPSVMLPTASPDKEVIVRAIQTPKNGTYYAIVNTGLTDKKVTITLPAKGKVINAANGQPLTAKNGKLEMTFYPCELKSVHVQ